MSLQVHTNLLMHGFGGPVYYVNPRATHVHGQATVAALGDITEPVDLAFVFIGGDRVLEVAEEAAACGIRNLVVLSAGFDESDAEGSRRQQGLVDIARENGQLILGPNTIGFINLNDGVVLFGSPNHAPIKRGPVGVAVQSGVLLATTVRHLPAFGPGMSVLAAVANEAVISLDHMIDYFVEDDATRVIALFMETTRDPASFRLAALRALEAGKPIVALASARTTVTVDTAISHTGALVGDQRAREAAFEELGIIMVKSLEDYLSTTALLANHGPLKGRRVAFTSVSGGLCEIFSDRAIEVGLTMPSFAAQTRRQLTEILPSFGTVKNPLDYTGVAQSDPFFVADVLDIITQDPGFDMVVYGDNPLPAEPDDLQNNVSFRVAVRIGEVVSRSPIPVLPVTSVYGNPHPVNAYIAARTGKGFEVGGMEHGPRAIERAVWWTEQRESLLAEPAADIGESPALSVQASTPLSETDVLELLRSAGVTTVPWIMCASAGEAAEAAQKFGYPVVLKVSSPDIAHKSRVGGVALGLADGAAVAAAFDSVTAAARAAHPNARIDGAVVMPMRTGGLELVVGIKVDRTWGHVLAVGLGGVWTEVLSDTALCLLPASPERIARRLQTLRGAALFAGGHGIARVDLPAVAVQVARVGRLAVALGGSLESLEVNPLWVDGDRAEALDGLLTWAHT